LEKVIFRKGVSDYFGQLVHTLFLQDYFGYEDSAKEYVDKIIHFILNDIQNVVHQESPNEIKHLGKFYITYNPNRRTTWYIFFEKKQENYLITHISNNHSKLSNLLGKAWKSDKKHWIIKTEFCKIYNRFLNFTIAQ